ncbi:MAG: GNAT family N-acetyltransferase [Pseudomonadota bacterium]
MNENSQSPQLERDFSQFDQHTIWQQLDLAEKALDGFHDACLKSEVSSAVLAKGHAKLIADAWRQLSDEGKHIAGQSNYILELEAGNGCYAAEVLARLRKELSDAEWNRFKPCYLLADSHADLVSDCWQHPGLRHWIEAGTLEPVRFDLRQQNYIDLSSRQLVLGKHSIVNPLTVLANGVLSRLRQSLYHIHYGRCFVAELADDFNPWEQEVQPIPEADRYQWRELTQDEPDALILRYVERFDSAVVLLPDQLFALVARLRDLVANGLLLISSDRGFHGEFNLRQQALPEFGPHPRYFLPINGHALEWHVDASGGEIRHQQADPGSPLHSVAWFPTSDATYIPDITELTHHITADEDAALHHMSALALQSQPRMSSSQLLSLLRMSEYDAGIIFQHLDCLFDTLPSLGAQERLDWRDAIIESWQGHYVFPEQGNLLTDFALLAMRLGAWGVANSCLDYVHKYTPADSSIQQPPDVRAVDYYRALCWLQLGEWQKALTLTKRSLLQTQRGQPLDPELENLRVDLERCLQQQDSDACYAAELSRDEGLSLLPLASHYAEEYLYQYRDPSIAVMTSLPDFVDLSEFERWRAEQIAINNRGLYAVVHRQYGFIGVVSLRWHQDNAFFYFWIGADYQGRGFGQAAAAQMFAMARETLGIAEVYTCAFADNSRSIAALGALGFKMLPMSAKPPDEEYQFFTTGSNSAFEHYQALCALLTEIESPIELLAFEHQPET